MLWLCNASMINDGQHTKDAEISGELVYFSLFKVSVFHHQSLGHIRHQQYTELIKEKKIHNYFKRNQIIKGPDQPLVFQRIAKWRKCKVNLTWDHLLLYQCRQHNGSANTLLHQWRKGLQIKTSEVCTKQILSWFKVKEKEIQRQ